MNDWFHPSRTLLTGCAALAVMLAASAPALAAKPANATAGWQVPRTAAGHPDLQGNWTNATLTRLERPKEFASLVLTPQEAAKIEGAAAKHVSDAAKPTDPNAGILDLPNDCGYGFTGTNCGYNNFWVDRGTQVLRIDGQPRSSFITDPADGQVPPLTVQAKQRLATQMALRRANYNHGPEARSLGERCLLSFGSSAGPPMLPLMYNNTYSIAQTPDAVMILVEMVHDARIIRIDGKPLPNSMPKWMGDSVGHWEGDTLVVETTHFHPQQTFQGAGPNRKVTERLTRISPDQILYQFTLEDPETFTQPFSGELTMNATNQQMYEYACHEGNYALPGILAGAREEDRVAAGGARKKSALQIARELEGE